LPRFLLPIAVAPVGRDERFDLLDLPGLRKIVDIRLPGQAV
jgi:hypothetical protein